MSVDVVVVGGAGHVGLPLAMAFADKGLKSLVYDINEKALAKIQEGKMPFMEQGADELLPKLLKSGNLLFSSQAKSVAEAKAVVVTIGTPVDEFLNPSTSLMQECFASLSPHLNNNQLIILRSTVYPGVTQWMAKFLEAKNLRPKIAFCPERIVQGLALEELYSLPQIVSGLTPEAENEAADLFMKIAPEVVRVSPLEAEFAKLMANAYRYIQFGVANQFYMICDAAGVDYHRVLKAMKHNYPRMAGMPTAGLAAGPCLFKDTMQLSAFYENQFSIGLHSMLVNEGMPLYIAGKLRQQHNVSEKTVGLLGMAFKGESDDRRSSLAYKMKKVLLSQAKAVLTTDPFVTDDPELRPLDEVVAKSDILVLCAPHKQYKTLNLTGKPVIDIWNFWV